MFSKGMVYARLLISLLFVFFQIGFCQFAVAEEASSPQNVTKEKKEGVLLKKFYEADTSFSEDGFSRFRFSRERPFSDEIDVKLNSDRGNGKVNLRLDLLTVADTNPFTKKMPFFNEDGDRFNYINSGDAEFWQLDIVRNHRSDFDLGLLKCRLSGGYEVEFRGGGSDPYGKSVGLRGNLEAQMRVDLKYLNTIVKAQYNPEVAEATITGKNDNQWRVGVGVELPWHKNVSFQASYDRFNNNFIRSLENQGNQFEFGLRFKF